jgi:hypothetical protein
VTLGVPAIGMVLVFRRVPLMLVGFPQILCGGERVLRSTHLAATIEVGINAGSLPAAARRRVSDNWTLFARFKIFAAPPARTRSITAKIPFDSIVSTGQGQIPSKCGKWREPRG